MYTIAVIQLTLMFIIPIVIIGGVLMAAIFLVIKIRQQADVGKPENLLKK